MGAAVGALALAAALFAFLFLRTPTLDTQYAIGSVTGGPPTLTTQGSLTVTVQPARPTDRVPAVGVWGPAGPVPLSQVHRASSGAMELTVAGTALAGLPAGRVQLDVVVAPYAGTLDHPAGPEAQQLTFEVSWRPEGR